MSQLLHEVIACPVLTKNEELIRLRVEMTGLQTERQIVERCLASAITALKALQMTAPQSLIHADTLPEMPWDQAISEQLYLELSLPSDLQKQYDLPVPIRPVVADPPALQNPHWSQVLQNQLRFSHALEFAHELDAYVSGLGKMVKILRRNLDRSSQRAMALAADIETSQDRSTQFLWSNWMALSTRWQKSIDRVAAELAGGIPSAAGGDLSLHFEIIDGRVHVNELVSLELYAFETCILTSTSADHTLVLSLVEGGEPVPDWITYREPDHVPIRLVAPPGLVLFFSFRGPTGVIAGGTIHVDDMIKFPL